MMTYRRSYARLLLSLAAVLLATLAPCPAWAQTVEAGVQPAVSKDRGRRYGGIGYFSTGTMLLDHDEMNDRLGAHGLPQAPSGSLVIGSGGYFRMNRIVVGGEGHWLIPRQGETATHTTTVSGGFGFFNFGYIVGSWGGLAVYPLVGIGGGGLSYQIVRKEPDGATFDQALDSPARGTTFGTGGWLGHLSIAVDQLFDFNERPDQAGGPMIGLRVGWALQVPKGGWEASGSDLVGGPSVGLGGPYLRLVIGGGGMEIE